MWRLLRELGDNWAEARARVGLTTLALRSTIVAHWRPHGLGNDEGKLRNWWDHRIVDRCDNVEVKLRNWWDQRILDRKQGHRIGGLDLGRWHQQETADMSVWLHHQLLWKYACSLRSRVAIHEGL